VFGLHPAPHRLGVLDEVLPADRLPDHRADRLGVGPAELDVARHEPGLEQGLELPGLRPALVVRHVRGEGPHQRALLAFGSKCGVDLPQRGLAGRRKAGASERRRQLGPDREGLGLARAVGGFDDVDHVDVTDVVELAPARLAHPEHGEAGRCAAVGQVATGQRERRLEGGRGEVGQRRSDTGLGRQRVVSRQVRRRYP
jgi:hypothetical protein